MSIAVKRALDFGNANGIAGLAQSTANGQPVVHEQLVAQLTGLSWKDNVKAATTAALAASTYNNGTSGVGATLTADANGAFPAQDGVTINLNDYILVKDESSQSRNGKYQLTTAGSGAAPWVLTRATDSNTAAGLISAVIPIDAGGTASGGVLYRQGNAGLATMGTDNVTFSALNTAPAASETVSGTAELATQGETDTGTDDNRIITPLKLANWANRSKRFSATIGDGGAVEYTVTHNLGTEDVLVYVREATGNKAEIDVEKQVTGTNTVKIVFDAAPASNAYRVTVLA